MERGGGSGSASGPAMSTQEQQLCQFLAGLPARHKYRYTDAAYQELLRSLFWSLAGGRDDYMRLLFPDGGASVRKGPWKLREAQGAVDGAEYTEGARGMPCGSTLR